MSTVLEEIGVSHLAGVKLMQDIQNKQCVNFVPPTVMGATSYSHKEIWEHFEKKFNDHYGTNYKFPINENI